MAKKLSLFHTLYLLTALSFAQPILFQMDIGTTTNYTNCHVKPVPSGGYIMALNYFNGMMKKDFSLVRLDSIANIIWIKSYNGISMDGAGILDISLTGNGGYIFVCSLNETLPGHRMLVHTDSLGNIIWDQIGPWYEKVVQTPDGGYVTGSGGRLIKTDSLGNILWQRSYPAWGYDDLECFQPTLDNGFILFGGVRCFSSGGPMDRDLYLVKTDSMGVVQWSKVYGSPTNQEQGYSVRQTFDGGYIMIGTSDTNSSSIVVAKASSNGTLIWVKEYDGFDYDFGTDIQETFGTPGYVITGYTNGFEVQPQLGNRSFLIKLDLSGIPVWGYLYGDLSNTTPGANDWLYHVHKTQDAGFILSGVSMNFGPYLENAWFIKTDNLGNSGCNNLATLPALSIPSYITSVGGVDSLLNEIIIGTDSVIVVTEQPILSVLCLSGPPPVGNDQYPNVMDIQIYPNPASDFCSIRTSEWKGAELQLMDLTGKVVFRQVVSEDSTTINLGPITAGMYFLKLEFAEKSVVGKVLKR